MRHKDTVAVTITLPRSLHEAVQRLAKARDCGNVSAVIRTALFKEAGVVERMELKEDGVAQAQAAQERSLKYSIRSKRPDDVHPYDANSKVDASAKRLLKKAAASTGKMPGAK